MPEGFAANTTATMCYPPQLHFHAG